MNTTTGLIEAASSTTEELFGRSPQVLVGKHISELVQLYSGNSAPEQVAAQLLALPPHTRSPDGDDTLDLKGVQEGPAPFVRAVITGAAREERLPLQVAVESEQAVSLQAKELVVWSCAQMEGVISITAAGIITGATLGAQALFGFRSYELIGTNVTVLMPVAIGRVHDLFLQRYQDMRMRKTVGTRRIVEGRHRDGSIIRIALEVSDAEKHQPGKPVFSARVVTTDEPLDPLPREVGEWQDTAEGAEEEEQEHEGAPEERATHGVMSDSATKEGATVAHAVHAAEETVDHARHSIAGFVQRAAHAAEEMLRPGHSHSHPAGPVTEAFDDAPRLGFDSQQSGGPGVLPRSLGSFDPRRGAAVFPVSDGPGEAGERAVAAQAWGAQAPVTPPQGGVDPRGGASLDSAFGQRGKPMSAAAAMMNAAALQSQSQPEQQGGSAQFRSSGFTEGASADVKASVQPASGNGPPHSWAQQRSVLSSAAPSGGNTNRGSGIVWGGDSSAGLQRQDSGGDGKPQDGQLMSRFAADSVQVVSADRTQWDNPSAGAIVAAQGARNDMRIGVSRGSLASPHLSANPTNLNTAPHPAPRRHERRPGPVGRGHPGRSRPRGARRGLRAPPPLQTDCAAAQQPQDASCGGRSQVAAAGHLGARWSGKNQKQRPFNALSPGAGLSGGQLLVSLTSRLESRRCRLILNCPCTWSAGGVAALLCRLNHRHSHHGHAARHERRRLCALTQNAHALSPLQLWRDPTT